MNHSSIHWWIWFDCLGCLVTPDNKVNLLDYLHPFFYLLVCLTSWQLPRVTAVDRDPFLMICTHSRSRNTLWAVTFLRGVIHPFIYPSTHTYLHTLCRYVFIFIHLSVPFLLKPLFFDAPSQCSTDDLCSLDSPSPKRSTM